MTQYILSFDVAGIKRTVLVASSNIRAYADLVEPVDPLAAKHFMRAADSMDQIGVLEVSDSSVAYLEQAANEIKLGVAMVRPTYMCR